MRVHDTVLPPSPIFLFLVGIGERVGAVETYRIASEVPEKRAHDWHQIPFDGSVITSSVTTANTDYRVCVGDRRVQATRNQAKSNAISWG